MNTIPMLERLQRQAKKSVEYLAEMEAHEERQKLALKWLKAHLLRIGPDGREPGT